jgi:Cu2+-exporting ATPase
LATAVAASPALSAARLPLCGHCGLPVLGQPGGGLVYCCSGCALAHRITGGGAGHGQATGLLMAVGVGAFLAMNVMMLSFVLYSGRGEADRPAGEAWVRWALLVLATPALLLLGAPFLERGLRRLAQRSLDTDALIVLGVLAAFAISVRSVLAGEGPLYLDTAMGILLFVTLGRYLEAAARARATDALAGLASRMPRQARLVAADGLEREVAIEELRVGDRVRVLPGETIPADGVVVQGEAAVTQAEITGEPLPVERRPGDAVSACTVDLDGSLLVEVRRAGADTTIARIVRLVTEARAGRYPLMPLVDRVSAAFVPVVLLLAAATVVGWTILAGPGVGLMNGLCVLLIACPCAIGIATPLASTAATGRAAAAGVLVRSGDAFERLARSRRVFVDKTGTLTRGVPELSGVEPAEGISPDELLACAAALESHSEHPLARTVVAAARARGLELGPVEGFRAVPGRGVEGRVGGRSCRAGSAAFVGRAESEDSAGASFVHLAADGHDLGRLVLRDAPRPTARPALDALLAQGLQVEVLSGDRPGAVAAFLGGWEGVSSAAGLLPEQKLERIAASIARGEVPVMLGDGINDAPALSGASVGVTLESGTDLAREVADVTVLGGDLRRLPWLMGLARATLRTARINLFWAFFYNVVGMAVAVSGHLHPLMGALAMIASSLLVVLHSQRLARYPLPVEGP